MQRQNERGKELLIISLGMIGGTGGEKINVNQYLTTVDRNDIGGEQINLNCAYNYLSCAYN